MMLRLTSFPEESTDLAAGDQLIVNTDQIMCVHASKITRKMAIIGQVNEIVGSIVTFNNNRAIPVKETVDAIYAMLPYPLKRMGVEALAPSGDVI